ncbi:HNH endonuclease signature motif containing protein [Georgenia sp. H159]|uniref:HNH endonuclease signature motif containing protein n=1 Tax=Georgenia sp. H159 TaxID=3076115 RepID=UPI002D77FE5A|nr:DUF222 domain-containing protein [Georgenia sp. H159]
MGPDDEARVTRGGSTPGLTAERRAAVDVAEWPELPPLPPDPLESEPVAEEPPWLEYWLAGLDAGPELDGDAAPEHVPSELLATIEPGLLLAAELESIDPRELDEYHLVEAIAGYQRLAAWAHHRMTELTGHLARRPLLNPRGVRPSGEYVVNVAAHELAPRLGISKFAAQRMVDNAHLFATTLEDTGAALQEGRIDNAKASAIARLLKDQPPDVAWEVQQVVLPDAGHQTVTQVEQAVSRAIISIDPHRATARHRQAREKRRVNHPRPLPDGMSAISAVLPATDAAGLDLALEAAARTARAAGDTRTIDQLRADALALLGHGALDHGFIGAPPERHSIPDHEVTGAVEAEGSADGGGLASSADGVDGVDGADGADGADAETSADGVEGADAETSADGVHVEGSADRGGSADGEGRTDSASVQPGDSAEPTSTGGGASADPPPTGAAPAPSDNPVMHTGNSFLRTPHMPIGGIGGRRAQIKVVVPLSVLVQPLRDSGQATGEGSARNGATGESSARNGAAGSLPGSGGGSPPTGGEPPAPDDPPDDYGFPEDWHHGPPVEVAELDGYGPITPDVAQALAYSGGTWQRLVTDPLSGELLDVGRTRYRPPAAIADFVRNRDRTCVCPGCSVPAQSCQLDHIDAWEFGGVTSADNLGSMCTGEHLVKTVGAFRLRHLGGGSFQWTTPTGHHYLRDRTGRVTPLGRGTLPGDARARDAFADRPPF